MLTSIALRVIWCVYRACASTSNICMWRSIEIVNIRYPFAFQRSKIHNSSFFGLLFLNLCFRLCFFFLSIVIWQFCLLIKVEPHSLCIIACESAYSFSGQAELMTFYDPSCVTRSKYVLWGLRFLLVDPDQMGSWESVFADRGSLGWHLTDSWRFTLLFLFIRKQKSVNYTSNSPFLWRHVWRKLLVQSFSRLTLRLTRSLPASLEQ